MTVLQHWVKKTAISLNIMIIQEFQEVIEIGITIQIEKGNQYQKGANQKTQDWTEDRLWHSPAYSCALAEMTHCKTRQVWKHNIQFEWLYVYHLGM